MNMLTNKTIRLFLANFLLLCATHIHISAQDVSSSKLINHAGPAASNTGSTPSISFSDNTVVSGRTASLDGAHTAYTFSPTALSSTESSNLTLDGVDGAVRSTNWNDDASNKSSFGVEKSIGKTTFTSIQ